MDIGQGQGYMNKLKKLTILTRWNEYNSKRYFSVYLAQALHEQGVEIQFLDGSITLEVLDQIKKFDPDMLSTFHSSIPDEKHRFWFDLLDPPHLTFAVDPILYFRDLLAHPKSFLTCVDRHDCEIMRDFGFSNGIFLPHAVEKDLTFDPKSDRPYEVTFLGTCVDYEFIRRDWQQRLSSQLCAVLEQGVGIMEADDTISLDIALKKACAAEHFDLADLDEEIGLQCFKYLDKFTRGKDRVDLIRAITDMPVHIFGVLDREMGNQGWEHYVGKQSNVTIHPAVTYEEAMQIMKQSKIVLNSMPFFRDGSHERIFTGLACGCLPLTSESKFLREEFKDGEELLFYRAGRKNEVGKYLKEWLGDEKKRRIAVEKGREKVMQRHTWDNRATTLIEKLPPLLKSYETK